MVDHICWKKKIGTSSCSGVFPFAIEVDALDNFFVIYFVKESFIVHVKVVGNPSITSVRALSEMSLCW